MTGAESVWPERKQQTPVLPLWERTRAHSGGEGLAA